MVKPTVLISGGGVAGAVAAAAFSRAGWDCTVVERDSSTLGGQVIDVRGPAVEVLARLGVLDDVRRVAVREHGTAYWDRRGRRVVEIPTGTVTGAHGVVADLEVMRGDLVTALRRATGDTEWRWGDSVTRVAADGDSVDVGFERSASRRFDLVVVADGLHSRVRSLVFRPESSATSYLGGYIAWFTAPARAGLDDGWLHIHAMARGRTLLIRADRAPGQVKAAVLLRTPPLEIDRRDAAAQRRWVADQLADGSWIAPELADAALASDDFHLDPLARVELPAWSEGRVALVGDAAWCGTPLTGQGTAMAIVGAYQLAASVTGADDPVLGLPRYEAALREWIRRRQTLVGGGLATMAPMTQRGVDLALTVSRAMTRWPLRLLAARLLADRPDDFTLPDAPAPTRRVAG